nr:chemosensory receptor [Caenorhabditis elegans]
MIEQCELAYQLNNHPIYTISELWSCLVSLFAIPSLIYFLTRKVMLMRFHGNLKVLLMAYFSSLLLLSTVTFLGYIYQITSSQASNSKCGLLLESKIFKLSHIPLLFMLTCSLLLPIGFSIERSIALRMAKKYEHVRTFLGPILVFILVGIDFLAVKLDLENETFSGPYLSFILVPSTSATQFNIFFVFLLAVQIFNLICNCFLLKIQRRLNLRYLRRDCSLSLRYEMEEISQSSKFTLIVSFTHALFAGWYVICALLTRKLGESFFNFPINQVIIFVAAMLTNQMIRYYSYVRV